MSDTLGELECQVSVKLADADPCICVCVSVYTLKSSLLVTSDDTVLTHTHCFNIFQLGALNVAPSSLNRANGDITSSI